MVIRERKLDPVAFCRQCQKRIQAWQVYGPLVYSSYQRLYLATQSKKKIPNLTPAQTEIICKLLTGLNFRQISALIHKDELIVAQILYPAIVNRIIILRSPQTPFTQLPIISSNNPLRDIDLEKVDITDY